MKRLLVLVAGVFILSITSTPAIAQYCGDGIVNQPNEDCDDGNNLNGDCCDENCNFEPFESPCGDPSDTDCTDPDICIGNGYCSPRNSSGGTPCTDDFNICTDDECSGGGVCFHINNSLLCDDGLYCNGTDSCSGGTCSVHTGDPCTPLFCDEGLDICAALDSDNDGVLDNADNCPEHPNGPVLGTCVMIRGNLFVGIGVTCTEDGDCADDELCDLAQFDFDGTGVGDACECRGNFDGDRDIDGNDAFVFKLGFGRSDFFNPCPSNQQPNEFGRSSFRNPRPICTGLLDWCIY